MRKIGGREAEILKKYKESRVIDPKDKDTIEKLKILGFIKTGFSIKKKERTAKRIKTSIMIGTIRIWSY